MGKSFLVTVTNDLNQDQRMHRICKAISDEGHQVTLLGRKKPSSSALLDQPFAQKRLKCFFTKGIFFYLEYNIRMLLYALRMKPDVIYSVDLDTLLGGGLANRFLKSKQIHDAHEYFVEVPELEGQRIKKWIWNKVGKKFIPGCDLCFSVNQELADILTKLYNQKFHVVRSVPFLSQSEKVKKQTNQPIAVLYQGVLNKGRGLEEAIQAVHNMNRNIILKIAGEGDLSKDLRQLAEQLQVGDKVKFLGWLTPDKLRQETSKADIGLNLLSASSLNYEYSLANKFFDYIHASIPSVNMNFPVYQRICNEDPVGICIDDLDQKSIQEALLSLIDNPEKIERIQKACEIAKTKYNWQIESKVLTNLINEHICKT